MTSHDPIRGDNTPLVYLPVVSGEGDPAGVPNRPGNRIGVGRFSIQRPKSGGTSRMVSGKDWLPDVPVVEEPLFSVSVVVSHLFNFR